MEVSKKQNIFQRIRSMDLTSGNLFAKLGIFALPMALTTILQLLYTTVDLITVHLGNPVSGETSAAAISGNGALINLIVVMFSSMSIGANVAIGNAVGAKDHERARKIMHTSLIFALLCGIIVGIFGFIMTPYLLELIKIDPSYEAEATQYMRIYFMGLPFLMLYNYSAQIHRATGDSSTPFFALFIAGLVNVGFDLLFVLVFKWGVVGVASATVISEFISAALLIGNLFIRKNTDIVLKGKEFKIDKNSLGEIIRLGLPAGIQGFCFALPNTFIQSALYEIGAGNLPLQNGAIAANNINNYNYAFVEAISSATMCIVAQNYGSKNTNNIKKALWYGLIWITIYSALYSLIIAFLYRPLLSLYVDYDNLEAIKAGQQRLWLVGFTYVLDGYMDVTAGCMKGTRHTIAPAVITLLTCTIFRILYIQLLVLRVEQMRNVLWLYAAYPISWALACLLEFIILPFIFKKEFRKLNQENNIQE